MYVVAYFKKQDFVTRLPIKAQIRTSKNEKCIHIIKCAHVLRKNKVHFACAEQLWCGDTNYITLPCRRWPWPGFGVAVTSGN